MSCDEVDPSVSAGVIESVLINVSWEVAYSSDDG